MKEPVVHVGILSAKHIRFVVPGNYTVSCNGTVTRIEGECSARLSGDNILLETPAYTLSTRGDIILSPQEGESSSFTLRDVVIGVKFHWERKEDQQFVGSLKIVKDNDTITAVNILPVEEYLRSVISSEMSASSNMSLLRAHAVISRSWLLAQMDRQKKTEKRADPPFIENEEETIRWYDRQDHRLFDVCADDHCQRYQGITKAHTHRVSDAIEDTRGIVLVYNDQICDARYSKACGGMTENFENVWEPTSYPYLTSVVDYSEVPRGFALDLTQEHNADRWIRESPAAFCNTTDEKILSEVLMDFDQETTSFYRWRVTYGQDELAALLTAKSGIDFGEIRELVPVERGRSGRLIRLKIVGTKRTRTIGKELEIRRTLSPSHLYSSAFVIDTEYNGEEIPHKFTLVGAGWGHGVGLCQIGAAVMGARGFSHEEILCHYFKGAQLKKIY